MGALTDYQGYFDGLKVRYEKRGGQLKIIRILPGIFIPAIYREEPVTSCTCSRCMGALTEHDLENDNIAFKHRLYGNAVVHKECNK